MKKSVAEQVEENVIALLNSDITGYKISQEINVSQSFLSRLKRGESKIENTKWETIKMLSDYAERNKGRLN